MKRLKFDFHQQNLINYDSFISVDTGLHSEVVLWNRLSNHLDYKIQKIYDINCPSSCISTFDRLNFIRRKLDFFLYKHQVNIAFIEGVSYWSNSDKSKLSAEKGDLVLLSYIVGCMYTELISYSIETYDILFQEWGGQMTPNMIKKRVLSKLPQYGSFPNQHVYDAVGMGLSLQGRFGR